MRAKHRRLKRPGIALIVVLLVIAVIAAVVFEFCYDCRVKYHLAENTRDACQALYCAEAGLAIATAALEQHASLQIDENLARIVSGAVQVPVGKGYCTISIAGERGKVSVNGLVGPDGKPVRQQVEQMLRLIDVLNSRHPGANPLSYGIVPAIIDWIDKDDEKTVLSYVQGENTGAESEYYRNLDKPYRCRNKPMEVLSELMLIKGMTPELYRGVIEGEQANPPAGMEQFLSVYGDGRVNINEASVTVVESLCEKIDRALAESIVQNRPYRTLAQLGKVPGMTPEILQTIRGLITMQSGDEYYTVTVRGVVGHCVRTLRLAVQKDSVQGRVTPMIRWEM